MRPTSLHARLFALLFALCCVSCSSQAPVAQSTAAPAASPSVGIHPTQTVPPTPSAEITPSPGADSDPSLAQALALTPASARAVAFTDWTLAKEYAGASGLTSEDDLRTRVDFHFNLGRHALDYTLAAGLFIDTTVWSFDAVDLLWEARIDFTTPFSNSTHLFMFSPPFDFGPVIAHFDEYGYEQEFYRETTIYSQQPDLDAPWFRQAPLKAVFHAAILPSEHLLVFSETKEGLERVLDVQRDQSQSLGNTPAYQSLLRHLGIAQTAVILTGPTACEKYPASTLLNTQKRRTGNQPTAIAIEQQIGSALAELHPYAAFGYGFRRDGDGLLAVAVFEYLDSQEAKSDYPNRHLLALEGRSLITRKPYRDSVFIVKSAALEEQSIIFQLEPYQQRIISLSYPARAKDMLFAACPG